MAARIILFTKYPAPDRVKTRLISALGAEGAARLHRRLTEGVVACLHDARLADVRLEVRYSGATPESMETWLGKRCTYRPQCSGDLGDRLREAFSDALAAGDDRVLAVGSDAPDLTAAHLEDALDRLIRTDVVIGPASDGGYYLIGMRRLLPGLFENIPWGTERVLDTTLSRLSMLSVSHELMTVLHDVDRPEDLDRVRHLIEP